MNWSQLRQRIEKQIQPGHRGILKCQGNERRAIVSNDGQKIIMMKGKVTRQSVSISYQMIRDAYDNIMDAKKFDSKDFRSKFPVKYAGAPCRYSMTGGVLVEMGVAVRLKSGNGCYYKLANFENHSNDQQVKNADKGLIEDKTVTA